MNIEDVQVDGGPLVLASDAEVNDLEATLWTRFPEGYRAHVTRLGEGFLDSAVRVYPPPRIVKERGEWRARIEKYWFWDEGRELLAKERADSYGGRYDPREVA